MKFITWLVGFALKLALLFAAVVTTLELMDRLAEKNRFRYSITEDFDE
ncbi:MAG: hypothetical protein RR209_04180 [Angelakisella sp.]